MNSALAVYIHWPFCASKCPYCDFNRYASKSIDQERWRAALLRELGCLAGETKGRTVSSVFFGGGTPSLMDPGTAAELIAFIRGQWGLSEDAEITLEANPNSSESERFEDFREAGVNRLSLGVQSLDKRELRFLCRRHSAEEALTAIGLAAEIFPRFSFDMIYGLPGQAVPGWRQQLEEALTLAGGHLSLYQLTVEPGTAFHKQGVKEADEKTAAELYEISREVLEAHGYRAYEISNYARPGDECRHNLFCWRGGDYLGIGPGAHGRLTKDGITEATEQVSEPEQWAESVEKHGHGTAKRGSLSARERAGELLLTGLRLAEGVQRDRFLELTGMEIEDCVDKNAIKRLTGGGFLESDTECLRATDAGRMCLDAVLKELLVD